MSQRECEIYAVDATLYAAMYAEKVLQQSPRLLRFREQVERIVMAGVFARDISRSLRARTSLYNKVKEVQRLHRLSRSSAEDLNRIRRDTYGWTTLDFEDDERRLRGFAEPSNVYGGRTIRQLVFGLHHVAESASEVEKSRDDLSAGLQRVLGHHCSLLGSRPIVQTVVRSR